MAGTQALEEMEVTEHFWLLSCCCNRFSLKDASKTVTITGIIVGIFILVVGAGGSFLIAGLYHSPSTFQLLVGRSGGSFFFLAALYKSPSTLQLLVVIGTGVVFLVHGSFLLIYNIILLQLVKMNDAGAVFKTVKLGCLIILYAQLISELLICVSSLILLLADPEDSKDKDELKLQLSHNIAMLVSGFLGLLLTILGLCAIHMVKPTMLNVYIYIVTILNVLLAIIFAVFSFVAPFSPFLIISSIVDRLWVSYSVLLFALHFYMMIIPPPPKNQHQLQNFDV